MTWTSAHASWLDWQEVLLFYNLTTRTFFVRFCPFILRIVTYMHLYVNNDYSSSCDLILLFSWNNERNEIKMRCGRHSMATNKNAHGFCPRNFKVVIFVLRAQSRSLTSETEGWTQEATLSMSIYRDRQWHFALVFFLPL